MRPLTGELIATLSDQINQGIPLKGALPSALGFRQAAGGLWRFYSESWPGQGIGWWNSESPWIVRWSHYLPQPIFSFAEDVFGNQLVMIDGQREVHLLNHEDASYQNLFIDPVELLATALESGIDWIEFYADGSLQVAREYGAVPLDSHLHWTTPLILGGPVTLANVSVVPRDQHHIGHAQIWAQL